MHSYRKPFDRRAFVREVMARRGFTSLRQLALAADVPQPTLQRYMTGTTEEMETRNWLQVAAALNVTIGELFGEIPLLAGEQGTEMARHVRDLQRLPEAQRKTIFEATKALAEKADH